MKIFTLAAAALLGAAPALAQTPAQAQTPPPAPPVGATTACPECPMPMHGGRRGQMFANVAPEGQAILRNMMRGDPEHRAGLKAARDRINALMGADRLDVTALRRAMEEERRLVDSHHARRQAAMLEAVQKLSVADRKAFAADAGRGRAKAEARGAEWRKRAAEHRKMMQNMAHPPAPPAPPAGRI